MIANISRQLTTGALAIAGTVAAFGFAGAAQASTLVVVGNATIGAWGTTNPVLTPTTLLSVTPTGGGQFAGVTLADVSLNGAFALTGTGTGDTTTFTPAPAPVPGFVTIATTPGNVIGNITPTASVGTNSSSGGVSSTTYTVSGTTIFDEPTGPDLLGTFAITFNRTDSPGSTVELFTLILTKTNQPVPVPEPSAILGVLAVAGAGAFARRKS